MCCIGIWWLKKTADNFHVLASCLIPKEIPSKIDVSSLTGDISVLLCPQNKIWGNHVYSVLVYMCLIWRLFLWFYSYLIEWIFLYLLHKWKRYASKVSKRFWLEERHVWISLSSLFDSKSHLSYNFTNFRSNLKKKNKINKACSDNHDNLGKYEQYFATFVFFKSLFSFMMSAK